MTEKRHGGSRKGAGRPTVGSEPLIRQNVTLDALTIEVVKAYGDGNLSLGIRKMARELPTANQSALIGGNSKDKTLVSTP